MEGERNRRKEIQYIFIGPYSPDSCCPLCSYPYLHDTSKHSLLTHATPLHIFPNPNSISWALPSILPNPHTTPFPDPYGISCTYPCTVLNHPASAHQGMLVPHKCSQCFYVCICLCVCARWCMHIHKSYIHAMFWI